MASYEVEYKRHRFHGQEFLEKQKTNQCQISKVTILLAYTVAPGKRTPSAVTGRSLDWVRSDTGVQKLWKILLGAHSASWWSAHLLCT